MSFLVVHFGLSRYGLELHPDKTRLLEFGENAHRDRRARGEGRPETFDFLGFTHYCRKDRKGWFALGRKPVNKRMRRTLKAIGEQLRRRANKDTMETGRWLGRVMQGWLNYFAVPNGMRYLRQFVLSVKRVRIKVLRRKSWKDRFAWGKLEAICKRLWPRTRILHPWPGERFAVKHSR